MAGKEYGSLTKEPPLAKLDATILAVQPGMSVGALRSHAAEHTHKDAPGLVLKRFLKESNGIIEYDHFVSLVRSAGIRSKLVRRVMYFVWAFRDDRIRRFICEVIANPKGLWRFNEVTRKSNAKYFEQWLEPGSAKKARSNFEFFLSESGIVNLRRSVVDLGDPHGWVGQAATAAAPHENDKALRLELLADPIAFLVRRNWQGLLNFSGEDLLRSKPPISPIVLEEAPSDHEIPSKPSRSTVDRDWNRSEPEFSSAASAVTVVDLVKRERASKAHFSIEKMLADILRGRSIQPKYNDQIDIYFVAEGASVVVEIKSCNWENIQTQVRKGVSQLLEYRYQYRDLVGADPILLMVLETRPHGAKQWLADYLTSIGIVVAWRDTEANQLRTSCRIPPALRSIIFPTE